MKEFFRVY